MTEKRKKGKRYYFCSFFIRLPAPSLTIRGLFFFDCYQVKTGRPTKATDEKKKDILEHIKAGLTLEETARLCHVHRDTIYQWKKDDKDFSDTLDAQKATTIQEEIKKAITPKEFVKTLCKKFKGFHYTETTRILDGNGNLQQVRKVEKYAPPDIEALDKIQMLLEEVTDASDKQITINFIRNPEPK